MLLLLVMANLVPSVPILVTLTMKAIHSPGSSVLTRSTLRNIPESDQNGRWDEFAVVQIPQILTKFIS
jgi:hypothetical protein